MIFLLKNTITGEKVDLSKKKEYIVGRKNCDILLGNDQSISRKHAILRVKDDHVTLEDCKSKYHTLLNEVEVDPEIQIKLKHMDSIQFGVFNSKFCFESYKFMTAASALSADKKVTLRENLSRCNGKYVDKWSSNCTHLTVDKITLTIKVLQALIDEKPIVTPEYWLKYAQSVENGIPPPDINLYNKPPVAEQLLRSDFQYKLDPRRKTLFSNKMFVFLKSSIKKQMEDVVKSCDGECMAWEEESKTFYEISTSPKEHLIVKADNDDENLSFNAIIKEMAKQQKRAIPLNEIALAIVHCSTEINCNPNFNKVNEVFGSRTQKQLTMGILVADTQTESMIPTGTGVKTEKIIPSSLEDDCIMAVPDTKENDKKITAGPSGIKRSNTDQDNRSVWKKPKIEEKEPRVKEKEKSVINEDITSGSQKNNTENAANTYAKNKLQPSQKRKAEEDVHKSSKKLNPFCSFSLSTNKRSKVNEEENPFEITRPSSKQSSKSSPVDDENPFGRITTFSKNTHNIEVKEEPRRELRKEIKLIPTRSNTSVVSSIRKSFLNTSWMSKNTTMPAKNEIKEEDKELLEIAKAFKDCVKVQVLPLYNRNENSRDASSNASFDSVDGTKNFKKFKKVKPIKPQVTIIPRNQLTKIAPGEVIGIEVNGIDSDDEAGPSNVLQVHQKAKPRVKKFIL